MANSGKRQLEKLERKWGIRDLERNKNLYITEFAGGRDQAIAALSLSTDPRIQKFLRALTLRRNAKKSVYTLASYYDITISQMVQIMRDGYYSGILNEMFKAGMSTAEATIQDAQPSRIPCPRCDGRKRVVWPPLYSVPDEEGNREILEPESVTDCPGCEGKGMIRQAGSSKAQEIIFRATEVLKEKKFEINLNQNNFSGVDSMIDEIDRRKRPKTVEVQACLPEPD